MSTTSTTATDDLAARYRGLPVPAIDPEVNAVVATQLAHRSVRSFASDAISDEILETAVAAAQSASSSSNMQTWSVVAVRDADRRGRIAQAVGDPGVIESAPVLLVWIADLARNSAILRAEGIEPATVDYLETTLVGFVDAALAAQNALLALESLGLGGCYLGVIRNAPEAIAEELGLPAHAVAAFGMAIGYPNPAAPTGVKSRLPQTAILHRETYDANAWKEATPAYEDSFEAFYATQGREGISWLRQLRKKFGTVEGMGGRDSIRADLDARGLPSK